MNTAVSVASLASAVAVGSVPAQSRSEPIAPAPAAAPPVHTPTKIEKMWAERQKVRKEYEANRKVRRRLEQELVCLMPKPDQSIVYGVPENDADGLKYWAADREPHSLHHHIEPSVIKRKLGRVSL